MQYSLALALYDYIPIVLSTVGLLYVAQSMQPISPSFAKAARIAVLFIAAGGLCKATWKLLIASADINIMILNNALFVLMAPGFTFLCFYMYAIRREHQQTPVKSTAWRCPASASLLFAILAGAMALQFPDKKIWFFVLLLQVTVANLIFTWNAVRFSLTQQSKMAAVFFVLNIVGVFAMSGLARVGDTSESFQWIAQFTNTATQGFIFLAGWLLYNHSKNANPALTSQPVRQE